MAQRSAFAPSHHRGQGDDDGGQAERGDEHAVERAEQRAGEHGARGAASGIAQARLREQTGDNAADRELRTDRDIDLTREDDDGHADGGDEQRRRAHQQIAQVREFEERRARRRRARAAAKICGGNRQFAPMRQNDSRHPPSLPTRLSRALRRGDGIGP